MGIDVKTNTATGLIKSGHYLQHHYAEVIALPSVEPWRDLVPEVVWQDAAITDPIWVVEGLSVYWWKTLLNLTKTDSQLRDDWWDSDWDENQHMEAVEGVWNIAVPDTTGPLSWDFEPCSCSPPSFEEITRLLCVCCDLGKTSIEPSPLVDVFRALDELLSEERGEEPATDATEVGRQFLEAFHVARGLVCRIEDCARYEVSDRLVTDLQESPDEQTAHMLSAHRVRSKKLRRPNDERDAWIYEQRSQGLSLQEISNRLCSDHKTWYPIHNRQGISRAIDRYCKRTGHAAPTVNG